MGRLAGLRTELGTALRAAAPFLLSHHPLGERDRCHTIRVAGADVHLCARCTGIYPGIVGALVAAGAGIAPPLVAIAALPAPALVEWVLTGRGDRSGRNDVRTATGLALGVGYGFGLAGVASGRNVAPLVAVGLAYATLTGALLSAGTR